MEQDFLAAVVSHRGSIVNQRYLEDNNDQSSYLVDASGEAYEPYALSWRYLGMYVDCDISYDVADDDLSTNNDINRRNLGSGDNGGDDCSRKVLWAAYYDPRYRGHSIGEYQFYDFRTNEWDKSTCQTFRCAKLNCHERWNGYKLIGVFKETEGLYDWAEQLFKHEGYCVWDGDKEDEGGSGDNNNDDDGSDYEFMQNRLENWLGDCRQMSLSDSNGNTLYLDTKPLPGGNITYGLYTDEACSVESLMTFPEYVIQYYSTYYYNAERGYEAAEYWETTFQRWNDLMTAYKICQPCRAYNRVVTTDNSGDGSGDGDNEGDDDGGGAEEQYGYNCYDDAGYRNCNQCYKFETKTDMEPATADDLARATSQGTILSIRVDGKVYGHGTFQSDRASQIRELGLFVGLGVLLAVIVLALAWHLKSATQKFKRYRRKMAEPKGLKEVLADTASKFTAPSSEVSFDTGASSAQVGFVERLSKWFQKDKGKEKLQIDLAEKEDNLKRQKEAIEQLTFALDMEKTRREMERQRMQEVIDKLKHQKDAEDTTSVIDLSSFADRAYATLSRTFSSVGDEGSSRVGKK